MRLTRLSKAKIQAFLLRRYVLMDLQHVQLHTEISLSVNMQQHIFTVPCMLWTHKSMMILCVLHRQWRGVKGTTKCCDDDFVCPVASYIYIYIPLCYDTFLQGSGLPDMERFLKLVDDRFKHQIYR